jgi:hypothetical protein
VLTIARLRPLYNKFVLQSDRSTNNAERADHMKVTGAKLDNGMLHVDLVHEVPEAAKPRKIAIGTSAEPVQPQVTERKAAA